jgi:hypothetical protein
MCLQGSYMDLLSWQIGPYMIWYMMLVVSLCQLRYFQVENILFLIFKVSRYLDTIYGHSWIHTLCRIHKGA